MYGSAPPAATLDAGHLFHTFELATLLEAHAVSRAAARPNRDLRAAYAALDSDASLSRDPRSAHAGREHTPNHRAAWAERELAFHRALNDQGGNRVLSSLAERTLRDSLRACPIVSGEVLSILQAHHRAILRCVDANAADAAVQHTRAHLRYLRDALDHAARGAMPARVCLRTAT